jgi:hypothetical protein
MVPLSRSTGVLFLILLAISATILAASLATGGSAHVSQDAAQERYEAAKAAFERAKIDYDAGIGEFEDIHLWSVRWATASKFFGTAGASGGLRNHLKRMTDLEAAVKVKVEAGAARPMDKLAARYYCAEAEMWVSHGMID